jgi:mRNA interferase MazF
MRKDRWNEHKKAIDASAAPRVFVHPRELWFAHLGTDIGFEQDGRGDGSLRPLLVLRKFNNKVLWALPLTRRDKPAIPTMRASNTSPFPKWSAGAILSQLPLHRCQAFALQDRHDND